MNNKDIEERKRSIARLARALEPFLHEPYLICELSRLMNMVTGCGTYLEPQIETDIANLCFIVQNNKF